MPRKTRTTSSEPAPTANPRTTTTNAPASLSNGMEVWTRFVAETGKTATEFLTRFSEQQQKSYASWIETFNRTASTPRNAEEEADAESRREDWSRRTTELGDRMREAFQATLAPQRAMMDVWMRTFLPGSSSESAGRPTVASPAAPTGTTERRGPSPRS
ncbi:MAG: hypothetical protein KGI98_02245 [Euryarchaeota archaeon]|nr:hypothetical protein [Euryarchaeota archaeon]MDE1881246.1 hypothetical protein [Euryarchaeota archaeon]